MSEPIVIIGAGHAAVRAALAIRDAGYAGSLIMIADEGTELPYERPPLSKWSDNSECATKPIVPLEQLNSAKIECIAGTVNNLDKSEKQIQLSDGTFHRYSKLLLATGATARRIPDALVGDSHIHYLRNRVDAATIKRVAATAKSALIIGGGFIGLELAASLRATGIAVHVVDAADRLLSRAVSSLVSQIVHGLHLQHDVQFSLDAQIDQITASPLVVKVNGTDLIEANMLIAGVGSTPNTELAELAGLAVSNGICVDTHLRSSDPDIYAAGDCCSFPLCGSGGQLTRLESWQAAGDQGALAGNNMVVETQTEYTKTPWFWSEQYDHVLQVAGLATAEMEFVERSYSDSHHITFGINPDGTLGYVCGIAPGLKIAKDIRFSMKLMEKAITVDKDALANTDILLKSLR